MHSVPQPVCAIEPREEGTAPALLPPFRSSFAFPQKTLGSPRTLLSPPAAPRDEPRLGALRFRSAPLRCAASRRRRWPVASGRAAAAQPYATFCPMPLGLGERCHLALIVAAIRAPLACLPHAMSDRRPDPRTAGSRGPPNGAAACSGASQGSRGWPRKIGAPRSAHSGPRRRRPRHRGFRCPSLRLPAPRGSAPLPPLRTCAGAR